MSVYDVNKINADQQSSVKTTMPTKDSYLKLIEQYKDSPYYDYLLNNNPYSWDKQMEFSPNLLQSLGEALGDYSSRNAYYQNIANQQSQWVSNYVESMRQQEYNEPLQQVQRMRDAGLNPDLQSGMVDSGSASENDQPPTSSVWPTDSALSDIASIGMSVLSTAIGFVHQFQSIKSASIDNDLKSLSFNSGLQDTAMRLIKEGTSEFIGNEVAFDASNWPKSLEMVESINRYFNRRVDSLPYSRKTKKMLHNLIDKSIFATRYNDDNSAHVEFTSGYEKLVNDLISEQMESRNRFAKSSALPGAETSNQKALKFYSDSIYKPINDLMLQVENLRLSKDASYFGRAKDIGLGANQADAENSMNLLKKDILNIKKNITSTFQRINYKIRNAKGITPMWKIAFEAGLSSAEALIFSKLAIQ